MRRSLAMAVLWLVTVAPSQAAEPIKVGFISTLSGPSSAIGIDIRDAFNLALKHTNGKLGGLVAEVIFADDQQSPDVGKQLADKMLKKEKVDIVTGIVFSNILLAVVQPILQSETFYISANAGAAEMAGERCSPYFFNAAWQTDDMSQAIGKHVSDQGFKKVFLVVPNYPGGRDSANGFKRSYKGTLAGEIYTKLGQLDYAAELAQVRSANPDAVFFFLPGGMGINFIKQFTQAGLAKTMPLFAPGFSADEDTIRAVGEPMLGIFNSSHWNQDLDNAANKRFVADFEKEYARLPSMYASQGYDTAMLIDAAVRDVKGKLDDKPALRKAFEAANFKSVRGDFKFNRNHFPIQNLYLRQVVKNASGRIGNKIVGTIYTQHRDAYVEACKMN
jgi:branched-chain amino acid transport system substrate-binding protein